MVLQSTINCFFRCTFIYDRMWVDNFEINLTSKGIAASTALSQKKKVLEAMAVHCRCTCTGTCLGTAPLPNACTRISSVRQLCGENKIPLCIIYLYHPPFGQIETIAYVPIDEIVSRSRDYTVHRYCFPLERCHAPLTPDSICI